MRHFKKIDWSVSLTVLFACVLTVVAACVESSGPLGGPNVIEVGTVSSVQITLAQSTLSPGQVTQATVVAKSADGEVVSGPVDYSSRNPSIATTSSTGKVTALSAGTAVIQASMAGLSATTNVTVQSFDSPAPPSGVIAFHDFNDGTAGPYVQGVGLDADTTDFPNDPTNSGHGKVARMLYNPIDVGAPNSNDEGLVYDAGSTHLRYGQTIWMRGEVYLPSTMIDGVTPLSAHQQGDNRKLIDYSGGGVRMTLHRVEAGGRLVLRLSIVDWMSGSSQEVMDTNTGIELADDRWYTIEVKLVTNSADNVRDGVLEIYMDGAATPTFSQTTGLGWITEAYPGGSFFSYYKFGSQLTIQYPTDPAYSEYRYWDNVAFSTTRIER